MGEYIVSARKYRPSAFDAVAGQEALTTTLKNAIAAGKLAHAYLFCGPRGVGKTTCARIFAKTINCLHPSGNGEACDECESCKAFNEQRSLNIHELDAASNNSVEEIRALIEKVRIPPQVGRYKVFIIDEVHMLSTAAFNAFLKTLEEPPSYVIFILATTEKHKILPTILSRCQVYDFNRMDVQTIVDRLKFVAKKEGYAYEPEALDIIAQKADGGMRDALSIFDQAASFTGGNLTYGKVIGSLNVLDYEYYFRLTDHFLKNEAAECLLVFNEILGKGFEGGHFIGGLASHLRDLLVSRDATTLPLLEVSDSVRARYQEQARRCAPRFLYRAIKLCNDCDLNYRASKNKRLLVEITLIQLSQLTSEDDGDDSGRSPEKTLKPLFNQPAGTARPDTAPSGARKPQAPGEEAASVVQDRTAAYETRKSPFPAAGNTERRPPKVRLGSFGPSISRLRQGAGNPPGTSRPAVPPSATAAPAEAPEEEGDNPVTEDGIRLCWHEFAALMPQEETAIAQRMKVIRPRLLKDAAFEVLVDNGQVKLYMEQIARRIEAHMRKKLHNRNISMTVRVAEPTEVARITSKPQQYQVMSKRNPALQKLTETFGLELA